MLSAAGFDNLPVFSQGKAGLTCNEAWDSECRAWSARIAVGYPEAHRL